MAVAGTGFLSTCTDKIRTYVNDPGASAMFTDAQLLTFVRRAYSDVLSDVYRVSRIHPRARFDIAVIADRREYILPANLSKFLMLEKVDADGNMEWEMIPNHPLSPRGPGFTVEGPIIRFDPVWKTGYTMRLTYVPNADASIFECSVGDDASNDWWNGTAAQSQIYIATSGSATPYLIAGSVDSRVGAYVGWTLRILSVTGEGTNNVQQERVITDYYNQLDLAETGEIAAKPRLTVKPGFDPLPTAGSGSISIEYEVVPQLAYRFEDIIALKVARFIANMVGDTERAKALHDEYSDVLRTIRLDHVNAEARVGGKMQRSVRGYRRRGRTG